MLNDGNIGFTDYYTNWYIATKNTIAIEVKASNISKTGIVTLSFLNDVRHKIFLPQKVLVTVDGRKYESNVPVTDSDKPVKVTVEIPIEIKPDDKIITVEVVKQKEYKNKSVACDEVLFK